MLRQQGVDPEVAPRLAAEAGDPFLGAVERRVLEDGRSPSDLEHEACAQALERSGVAPDEVDLLLTFSHLADVAAPSNAPLLADRLGLRSDVLAFGAEREGASLPMHLELAARLIGTGRYRHALLVQSAITSRLSNPANITSRVLGDAAVATVMGPVPVGQGFVDAGHATLGSFHRMAQLLPQPDHWATPWYDGEAHRSKLTWQSPDPALSRRMGAQLATVFESVAVPLLARAGVEASDLDWLVSYEPRPWAPAVFCERLGLGPEQTVSRFAQVGYPLAASVGLALEALADSGRASAGDLVLIYSKGSGAHSSAVLFRWCG
ncbi:MAG: hypothetical protein JJ863_02820 [Deltaproteobacteria bacterium]|nr:hypothetical protein [Deltaproteobacteria bacterium]